MKSKKKRCKIINFQKDFICSLVFCCFQHVLDMVLRKKREAVDSENQISPQIDTLLLLDRNIDLLTPLFSQLTYEGLIDELYGIQNSESQTFTTQVKKPIVC